MRPVIRLEITFNGILPLAELRLRQTFANEFKSAVVASEVTHHGFARMFQTLNDHPQISIGILRDAGSALQWLEGPDRDAPRESRGIRANAL